MPLPLLKSIAAKTGKPLHRIEALWNMMKHKIDKNYKHYWPTVVAKVKQMAAKMKG